MRVTKYIVFGNHKEWDEFPVDISYGEEFIITGITALVKANRLALENPTIRFSLEIVVGEDNA